MALGLDEVKDHIHLNSSFAIPIGRLGFLRRELDIHSPGFDMLARFSAKLIFAALWCRSSNDIKRYPH